jgi:hypothetical protein
MKYRLHLTAVAPRSAKGRTDEMMDWMMRGDTGITSLSAAGDLTNVRLGVSMNVDGPKRSAKRYAQEWCEHMTEVYGYGILRWTVDSAVRMHGKDKS